MIEELAKAIRNLANFGRLSEEDEENLHIILDMEDEPVAEKPEKAKTTTGGSK